MLRATAAAFIILTSAVVYAAEGLSPLVLKDLRHEQLAWQAQDGAKAEVKQAGAGLAVSMAFARPSAPMWTAHLAVEDWSAQGTLLLDFAAGDATRLVIGLRDIYGAAGACVVDVPAAGGVVKVPLSSLYLQGLTLRYVKSVAFWSADAAPRTVSLKGVSLSAEGFSAGAYGSQGRNVDWARAVTDTAVKLLRQIHDGTAKSAD